MVCACTFVDFRDKAKFEKGHIEGANHVVYSDMFSKPMMEELNKSNSLVINFSLIINHKPQFPTIVITQVRYLRPFGQ